MSVRTRLRVLASLLGGIALLIPVAVSAQTAGSFASPPVFGPTGLAFAVFNPGTVAELESAAARAGANGVWAQATDGRSYLLVINGPAFLSEAFRGAMPARFTAPTAVTLTRSSEGASSPASTATAVASPAATATPAPPASVTPTPTPGSSTSTPKANVPPGAPAKEITISGDLRDDSRTKFALDLVMVDTLPAIRAGASIAQQEVTYARACRWRDAVEPFLCTDEAGPSLTNIRPRIQTYLFDLPAPGQSILISVQLCNPRGCGEYVFMGAAVVREDSSYYSVVTAYSASNRVRVHSMDERIARMRLTYSDGLVAWETDCGGLGGCSGGSIDSTIAPGATVSSVSRSGEVLASQSVVIRGTVKEVATQQRNALAAPSPAQKFESGLTVTGGASNRGMEIRVGEQQMVAGITAAQGDRETTVSLRSGASVTLLLRRFVLPERAGLRMALFDEAGVDPARLPAGTQAVLGAWAEGVHNGPADLDVQARFQFILPASVLPQGASVRDLTVVTWDGTRWVTVSDSATMLTNGTIRVDAWFKASGFYLVTRRVG